jgi:hypothetical protein
LFVGGVVSDESVFAVEFGVFLETPGVCYGGVILGET